MTLPGPPGPQLRLSTTDARHTATLLEANTVTSKPVILILGRGPMCQDSKALGSPWCPEHGLYPIVRGPLTQEHVLQLQLPHTHPLQVKPQTTFSSLHVHTS